MESARRECLFYRIQPHTLVYTRRVSGVNLLPLAPHNTRNLSVAQSAAQQKENAVPKPKCSTAAKPQLQAPSGKENDTHAVPRKTKTLASSGASPRRVKKALGQLSLNSPRLNQPMVISGRKNKPLFSPAAGAKKAQVDNCKPSAAATAAAVVPQAAASAPEPKELPAASPSGSADGKLTQDDDVSIGPSTAAANEDGTREVVAPPAGMSVSEEKTARQYVASEENTSAVTTAVEEESGQETAAEVQERLSMMVVSANPRLQEVSALPRGKVVKAKLFVEEEEDESCAPETMEEDTTSAAVNVTVGDDLARTSVVSPAAGDKGDSEQEQQLQQQKDDENKAADGQPEDVVEMPSADTKQDESVVTTMAVPEKENYATVGASTPIAVSTEPAQMEEKNDEDPASSLWSEGEKKEETRPDRAVVAPDEGQDEQHQVNEAGAFTADPAKQGPGDAQAAPQVVMQPASGEEEEELQHVVLVQETDAAASGTTESASPAHVVMQEQEENGIRTNDAPMPSVLPQNEGDVVPILRPQEEEDAEASVMPSQPEDDADVVLVSQGCAAVTENAPRVVGEPGAAGKLEAAADIGLGEEKTVAVPGHTGLIVDEESRSLVEGSKYLQFEDDERTVLCTLTGKKLAPDYIGILKYMSSRRVQQLIVEGPFSMSVSP